MMTAATRHLALAATTLALVAACDPELDELTSDGDITFRCNPLFNTCGPVSNTPFTGALSISPLDTQGNLYEGIQVDQVVLFGSLVLDEFWADDGQLFGKKFLGTSTVIYSGTDFLGAHFRLTAWGEPVSLTVSQVTPPPIGEVFWLYEFNWLDGDGNDASLCIPTAPPDNDLRAVVHADLVIDPVTGDVSSRPDTVYIACLRGAAGEVAYEPLGYGFRPFEIGLAAFEGAMRFLRADYCGNGTSWTTYGEKITYASKWGFGPGVQPELQHTDAVWNLNGAVCIGANLRDGHKYEDIVCPSKIKPPMCDDVAAEALYLSQGRIWSALPDFVVFPWSP